MSKVRPSELDPLPDVKTLFRKRKLVADYWIQRVFQNTFTRNGRLVKVNGWSVKIQHRGKRSSFSLDSEKREDAAQEALTIYKRILTLGWGAVRNEYKARMVLAGISDSEELDAIPKTEPGYWKPRLIHRKYNEALDLSSAKSLSVRIQHEGVAHYFPVKSNQREPAAEYASQIYRRVLSKGWDETLKVFQREITVAVFWSTNPLGYTYTTLFTLLDEKPPRQAPVNTASPANLRVTLLEGDPMVRRMLTNWIGRQKGFRSFTSYSSGEEGLRGIREKIPELVLVNRALPDMLGMEALQKLKMIRPDLPTFTYGVYEDSDRVFYSFSGVSAGYAMRRRPPNKLLEPIESGTRPYTKTQAGLQIQHYFQNFFRKPVDWDESPEQKPLTPREHEILDCVGKGFIDKEIATRLGISPWTVHGHLRNIYDKLRVRTRTEAVVKYLQK